MMKYNEWIRIIDLILFYEEFMKEYKNYVAFPESLINFIVLS